MTQSIQSLERGLQILELLNRQTGLTANQVAKQSGLTRGTAFRVLETLRNLGYLLRDPDSGCYWLQRRVCALADGFIEEAWINQIARPEPSRIVDQVRDEMRTPRIERQSSQREMIFMDSLAELKRIQADYRPRRLNEICYEG